MSYSLERMQLRYALEIVEWEYPKPYHVYNMEGSPLAIAELMDGQYFTVFKNNELVGFFCFGASAQIKCLESRRFYDNLTFLDVGLGMHPAHCGRGRGQGFVRAGLEFVRKQSWTGGFRLTVDEANSRAQKVYERVGFEPIGCFITGRSGISCTFVVMVMKSGV